ncbi:arginase family protein [Microvirga alba]|uniref:Arginase n=1 Tax=Microvirga alba TaxID=2791025 RepID=A0A931BV45_9HYPH|nr:arginase family protein [Microvirga alba]MBF9235274.1 hypothetical protein [Microvirga alba]
MRVCILDCDGSVTAQPFAIELVASGEATVVDARDLAPKLRIVANRNSLRELQGRLDAIGLGSGDITFLGSGDFHHLTFSLLQRVREEVTVIHFDNHPDWVRFPATVNCGSWINHALKLRHVTRIVTIGPCGKDLSLPEFKMANLDAIREGALEVYAWDADSTRLFGRPVNGPSVQTQGRYLKWRKLSDEPWSDFVAELSQRLPPTPIWITLDKDVLDSHEAITNWDQGRMDLDQVLEAIERLSVGRGILGVDVCGDYSPPRFRDPFRAFLSATDRPSKTPCLKEANVTNDAANRRVLKRLRAILH